MMFNINNNTSFLLVLVFGVFLGKKARSAREIAPMKTIPYPCTVAKA